MALKENTAARTQALKDAAKATSRLGSALNPATERSLVGKEGKAHKAELLDLVYLLRAILRGVPTAPDDGSAPESRPNPASSV